MISIAPYYQESSRGSGACWKVYKISIPISGDTDGKPRLLHFESMHGFSHMDSGSASSRPLS